MAVCAQVSQDRRQEALDPRQAPGSTTPSLPPAADLCQKGHGGCSEHANCSQVGTVVTCTCLPAYEGDGWTCRPRNPCLDGHRGGCSEHADCLNTGPVSGWESSSLSSKAPQARFPESVRKPLSAHRTRGAVNAMRATWVMDCSVWKSLSLLWTGAWASQHPATQKLRALTYITRVCLRVHPRPTAFSLLTVLSTIHPPFFLQKNGLGSSTSRPLAVLMV